MAEEQAFDKDMHKRAEEVRADDKERYPTKESQDALTRKVAKQADDRHDRGKGGEK
jgi:hypothetical protein